MEGRGVNAASERPAVQRSGIPGAVIAFCQAASGIGASRPVARIKRRKADSAAESG